MEGTKEPVWKKVKKIKSATRYPKLSNVLVVAPPTLGMSEDKNEKSIKNGESDIDSDATVKTFTAKGVLSNKFLSEVKIDMFNSNQRGDTSKKPLQPKKSLQGQNKMVTGQPKVLYSSSRRFKRRNFSYTRKHKWKNAKSGVKLNNVRFKHKKTKINALQKLEKHYEKVKVDLPSSEEYNNIDIYTISRLVSKSQIKKRSFKKNILADLHQTSATDNCSLNYSDTSSLTYSAHSTKTPSSYTSQNTLVRNSTFSMQSDDFNSRKTSDTTVPTLNTGTFKTEIMNIALAVGFPPNIEQPSITSDIKYADKENETSAYTISFSDLDMELTSAVPSKDSRMKETTKSSYDSFILEKKKPDDNDTLVGPQTSSSLNVEFESMSISNSVAISENLPNNNIPNSEELPIYDNMPKRNTLLNDVMNFGLYPEVRPSTSSGEKNETVSNNGITTDTCKDLTIDKQSSHNNLDKSFDFQNKDQHSDNSLLNDIAMKALLKDTDKYNKISSNFPGIWEHFTLALNIAMSKLEERLADKIIREIKESLLTFRQQRKNESPRAKISFNKMNNKEIKTENHNEKVSHKEVFVVEDNFKVENDQCLQCHLVQNHIIDQVMLKLSLEGPKIPSTPKISKKSLPRPEIVRHYFDVIKPSTSDVELGKGDNMVTVSTGTVHTVPERSHRNLQRVPAVVRNPFVFIRENIIVITSVPAFLFVLSCLYVVMSTILRP